MTRIIVLGNTTGYWMVATSGTAKQYCLFHVLNILYRASGKTAIMLHWSSNLQIFVLIKLVFVTRVVCII